MRRQVRVGLLVAVVAASCGPVPGAPAPIEPINSCPAHSCSAYAPYVTGGAGATCSGGFCQVSSTLDYTLVVSLPDTSFFAPNRTFAIPFSSLFKSSTAACPAGTCAKLPDVARVGGEYWPFQSAQNHVGFNLGEAALPIQTVFRPLVSLDGTTYHDAVLLGLPLPPVVADVVTYDTVFTNGGLAGPDGDPNVAFHAELPPGNYERDISPVAPFDAYFPPDVVMTPPMLTSGTHPPDLDELTDIDTIPGSPPVLPVVTVTREDGAALDGWTVYLESETTLRRTSAVTAISNLVPTSTSPFTYDVQLQTNIDLGKEQAFTNAQLLLVPPAGSVGIPTLVARNQVQTILAPPYPILIGPPATVSGTVTTAAGSLPVSATLLITSNSILTYDSPTTQLVYSTSVATVTDSTGAATFQVVLPPGSYDVTIVPNDATSAKQSDTLLVSSTMMNGQIVNLTQAGKSLTVSPKTPVAGVALLSDGRPLAGAEVVANPAASLGPLSFPSLLNATPVSSWPRAASTTTAADGSFELSLDPGTYDLTIRPVEGTSFPWVVSPSRQVGMSPVVLDPIEVPPPIVAGLTLHDPIDNPVVSAIVGVYAIPTGGTAYVEIGRAFTDAQGHYDMFVAGTPH